MVSGRKNSKALNLEETKESYNKYHDYIYKEKKNHLMQLPLIPTVTSFHVCLGNRSVRSS